ncbi:hypothetical protein GGS23DRAFT_619752 [Durotheca rogersii]|uniref:uncharacterized protein n=1 Tax=Durotheca rogersii TaxID=419775 RepID=UPI00221EC721|nr:uncharacterized protein GGS23DRAFT_619752 [Durotheca rogersii]KAI5854499.1 hypothetical protein GGS23DRAFT_619752 [Durotheca rogersii]
MSTEFDVTPERRASLLHYFYRQFFVAAPQVSPRDVDLSGKTAIVTGASVGLGLEAARQLLDLGCKVIIAVRDQSRGERARREITEGRDISPDMAEVWKLDLASYDSVTRFAERARGLEHLDIAILNAGLYKAAETFGPTGYEEGVQVNYLSNVLLALLLAPIIRAKKTGGAGPGHIALVSSDQAAWARFEERGARPVLAAFKQPMPRWDSGERYGTTKLLAQLFVAELARRVPAADVAVSLPNPGFCRGSDLGRETSGLFWLAYRVQCSVLARTCAVGARTFVAAATTLRAAAHGQYVEDGKVQPMAPFVYTPEGQRVAKQLYEETLDELAFAGVRDIIDGLSQSK